MKSIPSKHISASLSKLDKLFSFFVLLAIILLAAYMLVRITTQGITFVEHVVSGMYLDMAFMDSHSKRALHAIAEVLILIKAYRILRSYLTTHHISVEYIVEISIIAAAIEFVFAFDAHNAVTNALLGAFGLANLIIYLHYFGIHHDEMLDRTKKKP